MNRRYKRLSIGLGASAILITPAVLLFSHWMNASTSGSVHVGTTTSHTSPLDAVAEAAPASLTTPYFSTTLPSGYIVKRQTKATDVAAPIQFEVVADSPAVKDQQLAITVGNLTGGGLSDIGDYNLRNQQTADYRSFTTASMPTGAHAFQTVGGPPGFTVFSTSGSHYIEVTMSTDGGATLSQLQAAYSQVMGAWQE